MTEKLYFIVDDKKIFYTIKRRARQKQINLIVHQDGTLIVTAPKSCTQKSISREIQKNEKWITKHVCGKVKYITVDQCIVNHMKKTLRPIVEAKLLQFNSYYNFQYNRISIRHQKTRWGSCSSEGNLNFNCKLMCLSNELREYVVAHELCHLKEMNHSKDFWELVEKTIPNYKELRNELKKVKV